jgi:hypothetical protein
MLPFLLFRGVAWLDRDIEKGWILPLVSAKPNQSSRYKKSFVQLLRGLELQG